MKRFCIFTIVFLWAGIFSASAQDLIDQKNRNSILVKVISVGSTEIRYQNANSMEMRIPRDEVLTIRYENGRVETINAAPPPDEQQAKKPRAASGDKVTYSRISVVNKPNASTAENKPNVSTAEKKPKASAAEKKPKASAAEKTPKTKAASSVEQKPETAAASSDEQKPKTTKRQAKESKKSKGSGPVLGEPTLLQAGLNILPAIPIAGKNLKFEFGGDSWIAKINGQNFLAGDCISEKKGDGYIMTLKTTDVWSGAVGEVIDLLQGIGVPLGPAEGPLKVAAKLASRIAKWLPLKGSSIVLESNEGPPVSLKLHRSN